VDLKQILRDGVEVFFTQLFRDGFFHAGMHPDNVAAGVAREDHGPAIVAELKRLRRTQERHSWLLGSTALAITALAVMMAWYLAGLPLP